MTVSYTQVTVSGYNSSPPPDDGSTGSDNQVTWAKIKTKLSDPLKTALDSIDDNVAAAIALAESDMNTVEAAAAAAQATADTYTAADVLTKIKTVDGAGSGLDADLLDGLSSAAFAQVANNLSDVASAATAFTNIKQAASATATGVVELATDAEVATGSDTARVAPVSAMGKHQAVAKAWGYVTISGGTPTLADSYGVTSITDDSEGDFTVNLSVTMGNANYCVVASASTGANKTNSCMPHTRTTTTFAIKIRDHTNADADPDSFNFVVFGDLA
jgi:hypothetical protein